MMRFFLILVAMAGMLRAAEWPTEAGPPINSAEGQPDWRPLLKALASQGAVYSAFTEHRWFPFKKIPVELKGEMRLSPERGLSLRYIEPEERLMVMDARGILLRDAKGHSREVPADARAGGASTALLPILRFDLDSLMQNFLVCGIRAGSRWRIDFVPKDPSLAKTIGSIIVRGEGEEIRQLEFRRSALQRVEIFVGETRTGVQFSDEEQRRFFR